ncbi:MAG: M23 family metallopeptidase [Holophagales bacterium]|nr:M23 family metallopeptidase [Holophagales bacterium]MYH25937.1 M23 family metallopeptidase [Holophagales bacterium]
MPEPSADGSVRQGFLQIHSPRGRVRYLEVTSARLQLGLAALILLASLVVNAALSAPIVVRSQFSRAEQVEVFGEHRRLAARFEALAERYSEVRQLASELDSRLCKIVLAYGVGAPANDGCGEAVDVLEEPALTLRQGEVVLIESGVEEDVERVTGRIEGRLQAALEVERAEPELVESTPSAVPLRGDDFVLVGPFGQTRNRVTGVEEFHHGIDLAASAGAPVLATAAGRVTYAGRGAALGRSWVRYGRIVGIRHGDRFITLFGHLATTEVRAGESVSRGQRIGTVGETGWSVEPSLHYGVLRPSGDGGYVAVDPRIHILDYRWNEEGFIASDRTAADPLTLPATLRR